MSYSKFSSDGMKINRIVYANHEWKELDITKRPELAFYSKDGHALSGKLLK